MFRHKRKRHVDVYTPCRKTKHSILTHSRLINPWKYIPITFFLNILKLISPINVILKLIMTLQWDKTQKTVGKLWMEEKIHFRVSTRETFRENCENLRSHFAKFFAKFRIFCENKWSKNEAKFREMRKFCENHEFYSCNNQLL